MMPDRQSPVNPFFSEPWYKVDTQSLADLPTRKVDLHAGKCVLEESPLRFFVAEVDRPGLSL
jgi:hypothetical protein